MYAARRKVGGLPAPKKLPHTDVFADQAGQGRTRRFVRLISRFVRLDKKNLNEFSEQFVVLSRRTKSGQLDRGIYTLSCPACPASVLGSEMGLDRLAARPAFVVPRYCRKCDLAIAGVAGIRHGDCVI